MSWSLLPKCGVIPSLFLPMDGLVFGFSARITPARQSFSKLVVAVVSAVAVMLCFFLHVGGFILRLFSSKHCCNQ
jgi:hypothetical protein